MNLDLSDEQATPVGREFRDIVGSDCLVAAKRHIARDWRVQSEPSVQATG